MEEYVNDAVSASNEEWFGEAYDKEWALKDQGHREGLEEGKAEIIKQLNKKYGIHSIMEMTGLTKKEIIECVGESAREEDFLGEAYDKEWALKDQGHREGLEEGMEKGKAEGRKEGKIEGKAEIVKNLSKKYGIRSIMEMTGLTKEEILECVGENVREEDFLGEAYDKDLALKDQGIKETIEMKLEQKQKQMVEKMLAKGYDFKEISEITSLSIGKIKTYQKES